GERTGVGPAIRFAAHISARPAEHAGGLGHQLHPVVRGHLLDLPRDPVGVRDRHDRRHLPGRHRPDGHLVRQPGRPPPEEDRHAGLRRGLTGALRGELRRLHGQPAGGLPAHRQPLAVGLRRPADARRDRRQRPHDRAQHAGHAAGAGGGAGPGQRSGGQHHGSLLPGHLGDQRSAGRRRRDVLRAAPGARRAGRLAGAPGAGAHPAGPSRPAGCRADGGRGTGCGARPGRRLPGRCTRPPRRPARHPAAGARRAGSARADRLHLLQQLPGWGLHGPDGRLRAVAGLGAGLGPALGSLEHRLHRRRPAGGQGGPGTQPGADAADGQRGALGGHLPVPAAVVHGRAGRRDVRLHADDPVRRGGGADGPAGRGALRAAGSGLRLRAERRAGRLPGDRLPDRPAHPVPGHPVDDRRVRRRRHRQLVRHRSGPWHRAGVRADRHGGSGRDAAGPGQPAVPTAQRGRGGGPSAGAGGGWGAVQRLL
ncbi:MAG: Multidrug resistance protein, partial [uncultured Friedmanniella sp.]